MYAKSGVGDHRIETHHNIHRGEPRRNKNSGSGPGVNNGRRIRQELSLIIGTEREHRRCRPICSTLDGRPGSR